MFCELNAARGRLDFQRLHDLDIMRLEIKQGRQQQSSWYEGLLQWVFWSIWGRFAPVGVPEHLGTGFATQWSQVRQNLATMPTK